MKKDTVQIPEVTASSRITGKFLLVGFLSFALIIPLIWLNSVIHDRSTTYKHAEEEIAKAWGEPQSISGPYLIVPYHLTEEATAQERTTHYQVFLPQTLSIDTTVNPQTRQRGIFPIIVYQTLFAFQGEFPRLSSLQNENKSYRWDQAKLVLSLSDLRGINNVQFLAQEQTLDVQSGAPFFSDALSSCVYVDLPVEDKFFANKESLAFSIHVDLRGTGSLNFSPVGRETNVHIKSSWADPSFIGAFLPYQRDVTSQGFKALWKVSHLSRSIPETFTLSQLKSIMPSIEESKFGVHLVKAASTYQQAERATKYGFLFILYTFLAYFLFEVTKKAKIHIVQYILTAGSLMCFFLMLTAFCEHITFNVAYALASLMIIAQVSLYAFKIIGKLTERVAFTSVFAGLYLYLFIVLRLEDYAFLIGALGFFAMLSFAMYATRNVDWFGQEAAPLKKP